MPGAEGSAAAETRRTRLLLAALAVVACAALVAGAAHLDEHGVTEGVAVVGMLAGAALVYLVCTTQPVYIFTLAIVLTPFAGNWPQLHVPGPASPDRLLFVIGTLSVLFRSYVVGSLPRPRFGASHLAMSLAVVYAAVSAMAYHALLQKGPGLLLIETFGVLPFISFWLGPVIFPTERERSILLRALVVMAAYLGLTALFETIGPKSLVFPRYILDPNLGLHYGRARGPFIDAVANGVGLYVGAVASAIAAYRSRSVAGRVLTGTTGALCLAGTVMTLERSIWISTAVATIVALLGSRTTRRYAIPTVLSLAAVCAIAIFTIPGLHASITQRLNNPESLYDRENTTQTALAMISARPLLGFGWNQYQAAHDQYIRESANIPLTATSIGLHSAYLTYGVELGLIGGSLWLLSVLLGAGGTALRRAPPELEPWRIGLVALVVFFLIGESAVPPTVFVNASLWLWAGVVAVVRYPPIAAEPEPLDGTLAPGAPLGANITRPAGAGRGRRIWTALPRPQLLAALGAALVLGAMIAATLMTSSFGGSASRGARTSTHASVGSRTSLRSRHAAVPRHVAAPHHARAHHRATPIPVRRRQIASKPNIPALSRQVARYPVSTAVRRTPASPASSISEANRSPAGASPSTHTSGASSRSTLKEVHGGGAPVEHVISSGGASVGDASSSGAQPMSGGTGSVSSGSPTR